MEAEGMKGQRDKGATEPFLCTKRFLDVRQLRATVHIYLVYQGPQPHGSFRQTHSLHYGRRVNGVSLLNVSHSRLCLLQSRRFFPALREQAS